MSKGPTDPNWKPPKKRKYGGLSKKAKAAIARTKAWIAWREKYIKGVKL